MRRASVSVSVSVSVCLAVLALSCRGDSGLPSPRPPTAPPRSGNGLSVLLITIDTLRPDHLGLYGYRRATSPHIDALGQHGTVFDRAFTFWPKTRGSFVMMMTGRRPSQNGYSKTHPILLDFNPTLAAVLKQAGYRTAAVLDNPNLAAQYGYARGFERYRETWEEPALATETDRARAITDGGIAYLREARPDQPFFLWLHYVNPHAPYTPPAPFDRAFTDGATSGPRLAPVSGLHGGVKKEWAVPGKTLGYYVSQYDGEIASVDDEVGRVLDALGSTPVAAKTAVVLTSDHGESLGEHDYYFDHGEDLFDPCLAIPLVVTMPGATGGRRTSEFASTLDLVPTILDAVKVSYPPDLAGTSVLGAVTGGIGPGRTRLFAQNDRNLSATFDERYKLVDTPLDDGGTRSALYDRLRDRAETRDVAGREGETLRVARRELDLFLDRAQREWAHTRVLAQGKEGAKPPTSDACEKLRALGYVRECP
ncbi:MAG TPA: sulfatase [Vicinamibacteria bacterium]|nr:sulfatase [Vicinamibacteria bacterium]